MSYGWGWRKFSNIGIQSKAPTCSEPSGVFEMLHKIEVQHNLFRCVNIFRACISLNSRKMVENS